MCDMLPDLPSGPTFGTFRYVSTSGALPFTYGSISGITAKPGLLAGKLTLVGPSSRNDLSGPIQALLPILLALAALYL